MRKSVSFVGLAVLVVAVGLGLGILSGRGERTPCEPATAQSPAEEAQAQQVGMEHLRLIGEALDKYRKDHEGEVPESLRDLYPKYTDTEEIFFCPNDPKASFLRNRPSKTPDRRPIYTSYVYQVAEGAEPGSLRVGELELPAGKPFSQRLVEQGENLPIVVCFWHQPPNHAPGAPELWLVLRLNGTVERVTKFVRSSEEL
ncbi:MAG: hypothetical protein GX100_10710 [candidate division WS1 bacterium]|nr:hypothetical protein [candidate division WS1 bacterium]